MVISFFFGYSIMLARAGVLRTSVLDGVKVDAVLRVAEDEALVTVNWRSKK